MDFAIMGDRYWYLSRTSFFQSHDRYLSFHVFRFGRQTCELQVYSSIMSYHSLHWISAHIWLRNRSIRRSNRKLERITEMCYTISLQSDLMCNMSWTIQLNSIRGSVDLKNWNLCSSWNNWKFKIREDVGSSNLRDTGRHPDTCQLIISNVKSIGRDIIVRHRHVSNNVTDNFHPHLFEMTRTEKSVDDVLHIMDWRWYDTSEFFVLDLSLIKARQYWISRYSPCICFFLM